MNIGRIIFANLLEMKLRQYISFIENVKSSEFFNDLIKKVVNMSGNNGTMRYRYNNKKSFDTIAQISINSNDFAVKYRDSGFNEIYLPEKLSDENTGLLSFDPRKYTGHNRSCSQWLFRVNRVNSRNLLTHKIITGIIRYQRKYLNTGNPADLRPFTQLQLTDRLNKAAAGFSLRKCSQGAPTPEEEVISRKSGNNSTENCHFERSEKSLSPNYCNSWVSRLVNRLSIITPAGEEKPLKWFFKTRRDINKIFIKKLIDKENENLESGKIKNPLTDDRLRLKLKKIYGLSLSRHSICQCRKDMGIPVAKRRLSGYKYPPLSENFSIPYSFTPDSVRNNAPAEPGVYELQLKNNEIDYPNTRTNVIYIGSSKNIRKRLIDHLNKNNKNGGIREYLKKFDCSFRYIKFSSDWKQQEQRLYDLFKSTYGSSPKCNRVRP